MSFLFPLVHNFRNFFSNYNPNMLIWAIYMSWTLVDPSFVDPVQLLCVHPLGHEHCLDGLQVARGNALFSGHDPREMNMVPRIG